MDIRFSQTDNIGFALIIDEVETIVGFDIV